jgi:N-acetylmuramoyl-L-alanine amidase
VRLLSVVILLLALAPASADPKIVIDPGHGGDSSPGGVGNGMLEKTIVLDVSNRFKALLEADTADPAGGGAWTVLMTRKTDVFVSLAARSQYANDNDADRFLSIHSNAFASTDANGTETFSYTATGLSASLRDLVQAEMIDAWNLTNRGPKVGDYAVLRETAAPAILHELAFITNTTDAAKLASAAERQKAAIAHLRAIQRHFGIAPYLPGDAAPSGNGQIAVRIVDAAGPVTGAVVTLVPLTAGGGVGDAGTTDDDGRVTFADTVIGTRTLEVKASGYVDQTAEVTVAAQMTAEIEIVLDKISATKPEANAGCSTSGGAGLLLGFLAFTSVARRSARCRARLPR